MRGPEFQSNQVNKRGIVVDRAPARMAVRVQFEDEDGIVSQWIDVLASAGGDTKTYMMPDMGDEVWCAMDAKGEAGCIIGTKYNAKAAPPFGSNDDIGLVWADGFIALNKGSGAVQVSTNGPVTVTTSGPVKIVAAAIELESATLTHNGTDISDKHKHKGVTPGPAETGEPV